MKHLYNYIHQKLQFKSPTELVEMEFWFYTSSILGVIQPEVHYLNKKEKINFFGIALLPSGSGKSAIASIMYKEYLEDPKKWNNALQSGYKKGTGIIEEDRIMIDGNEVDLKSYLPSFMNSIHGTSEGIYLRALALSNSFVGSLNITHDEIMDIIRDSNLEQMKQLYDGELLGKMIKSSINENIKGIVSNMLLLGSSVGLKRSMKNFEFFNKALSSGIYRRSFIFYSEPSDIVINSPIESHTDRFINVNNFISNNIKDSFKGNYKAITCDGTANEYIHLIQQELIDFANGNKYDERYSAELGSLSKIVKLAALNAISLGRNIISYDDIEYSYNFYKRCRNTTEKLFSVEPQHKRIYSIIKQLGKTNKSEILEKDVFNRSTFSEDMFLVEEYCYRNNERLITKGSKIKFFEIKSLDNSDPNKIILSIPNPDKREKSTQYNSMEVPMFGSTKSIEKLIHSDISNFVLAHFKDGKRKKDNVLQNINCIALDIDEGGSLEDTIEYLKPYTYLIYTTKSHNKDKGGVIADRFRVIIPFKYVVTIDSDRFIELYDNIANAINLQIYDHNAKDISRLWFTNKEAEIYINKVELFDPIPFLPETKVNELIEKQKASLEDLEPNDMDQIERRIYGIKKWFVNSTYQGNRVNNLFRLGSFVRDLTNASYAMEVVYEMNSMLSEPLKDSEIRKFIRIKEK